MTMGFYVPTNKDVKFGLSNLDESQYKSIDTVFPALASSGIYDDVHVIGDSALCHLGQVIGSHAVLGLEVRTAQIYHDSDHIAAIALDHGTFVSCTG